MRNITFRGRRTDNGEWVEGNLVWIKNCNNGPYQCFIISHLAYMEYGEFDDTYQVLPETVGQYTGLTDKNGKKIFEGDIVRCDDYIFSIKYGKCGGTPNADNYGYMGFYLEAVSEGTKLCAYYGLRDDICYFTDIEVIGNIWDNSVML